MVRRLRQQLELADRQRPLPIRGSGAVRTGITAADGRPVFSRRAERRDVRIAGHPSILKREEVHCEMNAIEVAPGYVEIARMLRPCRENHRIVFREQLARVNAVGAGSAYVPVDAELDAFELHLLRSAVDMVLAHLAVRTAVSKQAANAV